MTITSNILRRDYTANGINTSYAFDFPIFYESNATPKFSLEVIVADTNGVETTKVETTDYTITYNTTDYVNGVINQGNVVFNIVPTNNFKISLLRKVNFTQNNDITTSGSDALPGTALEGSLDKLTLMLLEQKESLNRVFKLPKTSLLNNIEFPIGASQANQVITVNNAGDNLTTKDLADVGLAPVSTFAKTLLDDTTALQARTTLDAQQLNANLTALANLTGALNKFPIFSGSGTMSLQDRKAPTITKLTSGSGTYPTPAGALYLRVRQVGPGGGGAGSGTIAANNHGSGGNGGTTSFGTSLLTTNGGNGGGGAGSGAGGLGGAATINSPAYGTAIGGGSGMTSGSTPAGVGMFGGLGAPSFFGGASGRSDVSAQANSGSGGAAAAAVGSSYIGGSGGAGGFIDAIIPSPSATYAYSIGSPGTGGIAGTGGSAGAAGGTSYIEVTEYYN
jgi:hypothetical protein